MFSFFSNLVKAREEWLSKNTAPNLAPIYNGVKKDKYNKLSESETK
jgi:hypothetical protein